MEDNPNPTPNVTPPAPEPAEAPAPEPAPALDATPAPAAPAPAPEKKGKGGLIAAIVIGAVILLGGIGFLVFTLLGKTPTNLANEAFANAVNSSTFAYKASMEAESGSESISYSAEVVSLANGETYFRMEGIGQLFSVMLSAFGANSDTLTTAFKEIETTWWKAEAEGASDETGIMMNVDADSLKLETRQKVASAIKAHPFFVAEKVTDKTFATSGDVYKITIDDAQLAAYKSAIGDDDFTISGMSLDNTSNTTIYFTVKSALFSSATLTGLYMEADASSNSTAGKMSIDFEHATKTAPAEYKNSSEMTEVLQKATASISSKYGYDYDEVDGDDDDYAVDIDYGIDLDALEEAFND